MPSDIKTTTISVLETQVSAPLSPPPEAKEKEGSAVTIQVAPLTPPESPTLQNEPFPTSQVGHELDRFRPSLPKMEPEPIVAVIGVGYVGTHLVEAFAHQYDVIAFDLSTKRLSEVALQLDGLPINFTSDASDLRQASHFLISVPTLLNADKTIDTTYLRSAISTVEQYGRPGSTIVIESSVAVGMTRALVGPLMHTKNFLVGMSPERVDPGRIEPGFKSIPKIISGLNQASVDSISLLYGRVFDHMLPVSSPEVAEMTKLYENCQRMVCAAYANEMANACEALGIDGFEVSAAAASKPFGYLPFRPGPGIGGHCIPVNPYYLLSTCEMPLLEQATSMSWQRPADVTKKFMKSLVRADDTVERGRMSPNPLMILVVGVGFKRGQSVLSNSPGVAIIRTLLEEYDAYVEFADPLVDAEQIDFCPKMDTNEDWNETNLHTFDGIIVAVDQEGLDLSLLDRLRGVKVQDLSGRRRRTFNGDLPVPTESAADYNEKIKSQITV
ncbi:hypothetical protein E8E13_005056 [Curvularia kusanoi]|uniref:Nucleotide sugar dehydrogenase n=1 Tax=Curvularia kusanoi TaxID=90978 RepID=A0A9P4T716_CURKU|nr:hypothetical protein E8E13_005056 [Curvularia kusanoi]